MICLKNSILLVSRLNQEKIKTQSTVSKKIAKHCTGNSRKTSSLSATLKIIATTSSTPKILDIRFLELCDDLQWYLISSMPHVKWCLMNCQTTTQDLSYYEYRIKQGITNIVCSQSLAPSYPSTNRTLVVIVKNCIMAGMNSFFCPVLFGYISSLFF